MKLESIADKREVVDRNKETVEFVESFYEKFRNDPAKVAPIINLKLDDDDAKMWPKVLSDADIKTQHQVRQIILARLKKLKKEIFQRLMGEGGSFGKRYDLRTRYLGDGRVALYWRLIPAKREAK